MWVELTTSKVISVQPRLWGADLAPAVVLVLMGLALLDVMLGEVSVEWSGGLCVVHVGVMWACMAVRPK